jgi:molybdopterin converting factor subunit 1
MKLEVRLFAVARELAGADSISVELPQESTVAALRTAIARDFPQLAPLLPQVLFAVGSEYARDHTVLAADADVACIPPVSGG